MNLSRFNSLERRLADKRLAQASIFMPEKEHKHSNYYGAIASPLLALAMLSACSIDTTGDADSLYSKACEFERKRDFKQAEKAFLNCCATSSASNSSYYQLASVNRLCDLENKLGNPSRAKSYMNQAATVAQTMIATTGTQADRKLAEERHIALARLANWQFESGRFDSAKKLYEQALEVEPALGIKPEDGISVFPQIRKMEAYANTEDSEITNRIYGRRNLDDLRGSEAAKRSLERHERLEAFQMKLYAYKKSGAEQQKQQVLATLPNLRKFLGIRDDRYRNALDATLTTLMLQGQYSTAIKIANEDAKNFEDCPQASIDAGNGDALENATFLMQDLLTLADLFRMIGEPKLTLQYCHQAQRFEKTVIGINSPLQYKYLSLLCYGLEATNQTAEAIPLRQKLLTVCQRLHRPAIEYAAACCPLAQDLAAAKRYDEAIAYIKEACRIATHNPNTEADFLVAFVDILQRAGRNAEAGAVGLKALPTCKKKGNQPLLLNCYIQLNSAFKFTDPKKAEQYNKCALELIEKNKKLEKTDLYALLKIEECESLRARGKLDEAFRVARNAVDWHTSHGINSINAARLYDYIADLHYRRKDLAQSKEYRLKALHVLNALKEPAPEVHAMVILHLVSCCIDRKEKPEAQKYLDQVLAETNNKKDPALCRWNLIAQSIKGALEADKDADLAKSLQRKLLAEYKSSLTGDIGSDLFLYMKLVELCLATRDKTTAQSLINEAKMCFGQDKQFSKDWQRSFEEHERKVQSLQ